VLADERRFRRGVAPNVVKLELLGHAIYFVAILCGACAPSQQRIAHVSLGE
jgi:hypothetical protein